MNVHIEVIRSAILPRLLPTETVGIESGCTRTADFLPLMLDLSISPSVQTALLSLLRRADDVHARIHGETVRFVRLAGASCGAGTHGLDRGSVPRIHRIHVSRLAQVVLLLQRVLLIVISGWLTVLLLHL